MIWRYKQWIFKSNRARSATRLIATHIGMAILNISSFILRSNNGDTALNNCNYFSGANRGASAHYFIGDDGIYQSVPDKWAAWAVGGTKTYKHPILS